ncbi:MAG: aromatic-ring-hydroxylating dioxygenase subunit beta [Acidobacteriota bacterium]
MAPSAGTVAAAELRDLRFEIEDFNAEYAAILDAGRVAEWADFFTEDAIYRITGRENWDGNLPVGLVYCEGMGMLRDRALAIAKTTMFAPRYLMHQISNTRVLSVAPSGLIAAEANYALYETLVDEKTTLQQVGRYHDKFARDGGRLRLKERHCVYDSVIIDTALIYPV